MMFGRGFHGRGFLDDSGCFFNSFGGGIGHLLIMLGIVILIGVIIYWIFKKSHNNSKDNSVLEDLKIRYVAGELTEEEYLRKKEVLNRK